jgi:hypothetical protein
MHGDWTTEQDLAAKVSRSLKQMRKVLVLVYLEHRCLWETTGWDLYYPANRMDHHMLVVLRLA